jgi:hypothetical protein
MNIDVSVQNYRCFTDSDPARFQIGPGFTAFVGVNNSGKSSLLRYFYDFRKFFQMFLDKNSMRYITADQPYKYGPPTELEGTFTFLNNRPIRMKFRTHTSASAVEHPETDIEINYSRDGSLEVRHFVEETIEKFGSAVRYPDAGIHALFGSITDMMYIGPFRNILNFAPADPYMRSDLGIYRPVYHDLFMGHQFVKCWSDWKLGSDRSKNELALRLEDDLARIFDLGRLTINASHGESTLKIFINGRSYHLDELGAGLAQFIVVLTNVAFRRPSFVLIDEPELNLHPALQLDFLTTLARYANVGVVFATHNLGLARSIGIRIYSTTREADESCRVRQIEATPRLAEFLGELSFSAHRELGFDKLLLVEGPTDVPVIQQFLRKLGKERQILVLPMHGSATINGKAGPAQLQEVLRITKDVAVLIDSERNTDSEALITDRTEFQKACRKLRIKCHVLDRRATENYLTDRAVKAVKGSSFRALDPYEKLSKLPNGWAKAENWKIAAEMSEDELQETDLGRFLASL